MISTRIKDTALKLLSFPSKTASKPFIFLVSLVVFLFSYWLIFRNNSYFSGDMAINGLILQDIRQGKFYSWYFYGQSYFGNLEHVFLSFLTLFTGIGVKSLYLWEHFFYFISVLLLLLNLKNIKNWQVILYNIIFYFSVRFYNYLYFPQGFSFVLLICVSFFVLFKCIDRDQIKINFWITAIVGLFAGLSFWHNPTYFIIAPIYFLVVIPKLIKDDLKYKFKHLASFVIPFVLGLIPLYFGALQTNNENLRWFIGTGSSGGKDILGILNFLLRDHLLYYSNVNTLDFSTLKAFIFSIADFQTIWAILVSMFIILIFLVASTNFKKYKVNFYFVSLLFLLLVFRGGVTPDAFGTIRYAIPFYTLLVFVMFEYFTDIDVKKTKSLFYHSTLFTIILTLTIFSFSNIIKQYKTANLGDQFYQKTLGKIKDANVKYIYCDNFYDSCATLAFLGNKYGIDVQLIPSDNTNIYRNPDDIGKADLALKNGEKVMSVIFSDRLKPNQVIVDEFVFTRQYYLIEGDYK